MSVRHEREGAHLEVENIGLNLRTDILIGVASVREKRYLKSWSNYFNSLNTETASESLILI